MEVGAVKQAFNNELILLKKKLNQAKTHVIHKLTRKAKTLVEKKAPETLKEKYKRKAESAINEVLITKKIKPRDIGKFILTHKGQLQDYLNKPQVDQEKACARLLLHKAMQDKYKFIRSRFSGVPINDLFMSRVERQKMKKEAREKQKEKLKKRKGNNIVNSEGDWNVEDIKMSGNSQDLDGSDNELDASGDEDSSLENDCEQIEPGNDSEEQQSDDNEYDDQPTLLKQNLSEKSKGTSKIERERQVGRDKHSEREGSDSEGNSDNDDGNEISNNIRHMVKLDPVQQELKFQLKIGKPNKNEQVNTVTTIHKSDKKQKDTNKNKNFNEKILNRMFKKNSDDTPQKEVKIVDPFFMTSTGENYMSLAEPRAPDEVKEFHKEGNRKLRRAMMFGHVSKIKPRQEFRQDNEDRFDRHNRQNDFDRRSGGFDRQNQISNRFDRNDNIGTDNFKDNNRKFNKKDNFQTNKFRDNQRTNFNDSSDNSAKPEKLHPSWEAKKRQSGILPFQGKKVVFNDD